MKPETLWRIADKHGLLTMVDGNPLWFDADLTDFAAAIEAALLEGKALVPVEPTEEMCRAGETCPGGSSGAGWIDGGYTPENVELIYKAMLQAAPKGGE